MTQTFAQPRRLALTMVVHDLDRDEVIWFKVLKVCLSPAGTLSEFVAPASEQDDFPYCGGLTQ